MNYNEVAHLLINAIRNELDMGTKHYSPDGVLLTTVEEIVECLSKGPITLVPVPGRESMFQQLVNENKNQLLN